MSHETETCPKCYVCSNPVDIHGLGNIVACHFECRPKLASEDAERREFERFITAEIEHGMHGWNLERSKFDGDYAHPVVFSMWKGWLARARREAK